MGLIDYHRLAHRCSQDTAYPKQFGYKRPQSSTIPTLCVGIPQRRSRVRTKEDAGVGTAHHPNNAFTRRSQGSPSVCTTIHGQRPQAPWDLGLRPRTIYSSGAIRRDITLMYSPLRPVGMGSTQAILSQ